MYPGQELEHIEVAAVRKMNPAETVASAAVEVAVHRKIPAELVAFAVEVAVAAVVAAVRRKIPPVEQQSQANNWNIGPAAAGVAGRTGCEGRVQVPGRQS